MKEIYLLHDKDLNLYKIGYRSVSSKRFQNKASFVKNGYVTDIVEIAKSKPMHDNVVASLERKLHIQYGNRKVNYPAMKLSVVLPNGEEKFVERYPNGHTEWFMLSDVDVNNIIGNFV